jgi:hypothetical protein
MDDRGRNGRSLPDTEGALVQRIRGLQRRGRLSARSRANASVGRGVDAAKSELAALRLASERADGKMPCDEHRKALQRVVDAVRRLRRTSTTASLAPRRSATPSSGGSTARTSARCWQESSRCSTGTRAATSGSRHLIERSRYSCDRAPRHCRAEQLRPRRCPVLV